MHVLPYLRISSLTVYSTFIKVLTAWKVVLLLVVHCDVLFTVFFMVISLFSNVISQLRCTSSLQ